MLGYILVLIFALGVSNASKQQVNTYCEEGIIDAEECCKFLPDLEVLKHPGDNNKYYMCIDKNAFEYQCSEGHIFKEKQCISSEESSSSDDSVEVDYKYHHSFWLSKECKEGKKDPKVCCKSIPRWMPGNMKNPTDCNTFYRCQYQKPVLKRCPWNLQWSIRFDRCMIPGHAKCTIDVPTTTEEIITTEVETTTSAEETNTPEEEMCTTTPKEETTTPGEGNTTPAGETTTPEEEITTPEVGTTTQNEETTTSHEGSSTLEVETTTSEEEITTPGEEITTPAEETTTTTPEEETTTQEEENTTPEEESTTPEEEITTTEVENTTHEETITEEEITTITQIPETTTSSINNADCLFGRISAEECCRGVPYWVDVLLRNPEDCGTFYQCVHEEPFLRNCPQGLHWNVQINRCDWPISANCEEFN